MRCTISSRRDLPTWLAVVLSLSYPAVVYLAHRSWSPRVLALVLVFLVAVWWLRPRVVPVRWGLIWGALLLAVLAIGLEDTLPLKLYPVLVNAVLLVVFAASLRFPPPVVERIARLRDPDLPPEAVKYTRKVTQVWCVFFTGNGLLALWTVLWGSEQVWFWYNGVIAYLLIGGLFAGEWCVRRRLMRAQHG